MLRRCLALLLLAGCGSNQDSLSIRGLDEALSKVYRTEGVFVKTLEAEQAGKLVRQLSLARNIDRAALATRLELAARDYGASLQGDRKWGTVLEFGLEAERLVIQFRTRAALAVVLDDYGHQGRPIRWLAEAPGPLNIAVIPFMPQSRKEVTSCWCTCPCSPKQGKIRKKVLCT